MFDGVTICSDFVKPLNLGIIASLEFGNLVANEFFVYFLI